MTDIDVAEDVRDAILATALDYYEGWFDGDATRMTRALHPQLVKRSLEEDGSIEALTAEDMITGAATGVGRRTDPAERRLEITVDHVHGTIATAHATGAVYVDYLQLVLVDGRWTILNALWARA
ncbi:MAG TPA: nuclear transport factor 2 family protein [Candidatus Angelobacter sp.]|nr:nuclear transport factor 2 family protein [Candidatus Angelobacter sp.]